MVGVLLLMKYICHVLNIKGDNTNGKYISLRAAHGISDLHTSPAQAYGVYYAKAMLNPHGIPGRILRFRLPLPDTVTREAEFFEIRVVCAYQRGVCRLLFRRYASSQGFGTFLFNDIVLVVLCSKSGKREGGSTRTLDTGGIQTRQDRPSPHCRSLPIRPPRCRWPLPRSRGALHSLPRHLIALVL